jgi:hypothetical protein
VSDSPAPPEPADSVPLPQGSSTRPDGTETRTSQDPPSPSESSLSKAIDALGNALGWKAIVVFFAVLVGVQRLGSSLFYSEFGVTPEEAGLGYDHMLFEAAAITSLAVVIPFVLYLVFTASFIARCGRGLRRRLAQASAQKSSTVTYVAHRSAIVAVFLAAVWLSRNAHGSRGEIGWLIVGGIAIGALLEVGEGITNPFSGVTIDSAVVRTAPYRCGSVRDGGSVHPSHSDRNGDIPSTPGRRSRARWRGCLRVSLGWLASTTSYGRLLVGLPSGFAGERSR